MTTAGFIYAMPAMAKVEDCEKLHEFLVSSKNQDVEIDCGAVTRLSGLAAQLLVMGKKSSETNGQRFALINPSAGFLTSLDTLGLQDTLDTRGTTE